jgi:hypothetical protein
MKRHHNSLLSRNAPPNQKEATSVMSHLIDGLTSFTVHTKSFVLTLPKLVRNSIKSQTFTKKFVIEHRLPTVLPTIKMTININATTRTSQQHSL